MRKARFTEHQIIAVIKSVEAGRDVEDVGREAGISEANIIVRFRLCRRNLSLFFSTLQLVWLGTNFQLPDTRYHFSASTRLFSRSC